MTAAREWEFAGVHGAIAARAWPHEAPRYLAILSHGYGEHIGRYGQVAAALVRHGAVVCGLDHRGHGRSAGEQVLITDFEDVVADLRSLALDARSEYPDLPVVLIGHSMGGMIATRYAQRYGEELAALVLSSPLLGKSEAVTLLLSLPEIPGIPIDPDSLSRDPAVCRAYAADPLVWHGPFKRPTLEAITACLTAIREHGSLGGLPVLYLHGDADQLVPMADTRVGIEQIRGPGLIERIFPRARHEIFNETNSAEVIAEVVAFTDRVLASTRR